MKKNKLSIRNAKKEDAHQIVDVLLDFYNMEDQEEAKKVFFNELEKEFHYIVAIENNEILGLITWLVHGLPKHGLFELDRICILRNSRGKGIGKKLVDALIDDAKVWYMNRNEQARKLYLLTHEDNTNAHLFYERVGFSHETTLKDHYYKDQDERVYTIFLK
tara:strand:- start:1947 stop:2432 length:486 start_codon:yes stop_codon:yes gene_type:complete